MENLQARILIAYENNPENTIAYLYYREAFDLLNIPKQEYDNSQFLQVGNEFEFEGVRFIVKSINFKFYDKLNIMTGKQYGVNIYSVTDDKADYNCQIGIFVDKV